MLILPKVNAFPFAVLGDDVRGLQVKSRKELRPFREAGRTLIVVNVFPPAARLRHTAFSAVQVKRLGDNTQGTTKTEKGLSALMTLSYNEYID